MSNSEIRAVLDELNAQELEKMRTTRALCYFSAAPFYDENGKAKKITMSQFWKLPGDENEQIKIDPEKDYAQAQKICELVNKQDHGRE